MLLRKVKYIMLISFYLKTFILYLLQYFSIIDGPTLQNVLPTICFNIQWYKQFYMKLCKPLNCVNCFAEKWSIVILISQAMCYVGNISFVFIWSLWQYIIVDCVRLFSRINYGNKRICLRSLQFTQIVAYKLWLWLIVY